MRIVVLLVGVVGDLEGIGARNNALGDPGERTASRASYEDVSIQVQTHLLRHGCKLTGNNLVVLKVGIGTVLKSDGAAALTAVELEIE